MMQRRKFIRIWGLLHRIKNLVLMRQTSLTYLSGYTEKPKFHHLVVAPFDIRDEFIHLIDEEIECHKKYGNGFIRAKMNSLTDKDLMMKLYEASIAGVKIELLIRGICCIRPGIPGISENITVT